MQNKEKNKIKSQGRLKATQISSKRLLEPMLAYTPIEKATKAVLDKIMVATSVINSKMEIVWINKTFRKWFPDIELKKRPICYKTFYKPARKKICAYCPTIKAFKTGQIHFSETDVCSNGRIYNVGASPVKDTKGKVRYVIETVEDITQRKHIEEHLKLAALNAKEEKAKSEAIIAAIGDAVSIQDTNFKVLYQNKVHKQIQGDQIGNYCYRGFAHKKAVCDGCPIALAFKDGKIHRAERSTTVGGKVMHFEITASPIRDADGKNIAGIEIVRDITQRKQAERKLRESELKYRSLVNNSLEGIGITCGERVAYANRALLEIFGYSTLGELRRIHILDHVAAENRKLVSRQLRKRLKSEHLPTRCEYKILRKDGKTRDVEMSTSEIVLEGGKYIQSIVRDITESKQALNSLELTTQYWNDTFNAISDGIWILDRDGRIIQSNGHFEQLIGLKTKDIVGKYCYKVAHCASSFIENCPYKQMKKSAKREFVEYEERRLGYWFQVVVDAIRDKSGRITGAVHVVHDITEHKRAEEALRESEGKYRVFFAQAPDSILLIDAETGALVEFNDKAHDNLGYTRKEFQKLKIPDFEIIESKQEVDAHIKKIVKEGADIFETKHKRKNGQIRDILVTAQAISVHGRDYIQTIWRDITERKTTSEKIRQQSEFLQKAIESLTHPFYVIDANDYTIKMANHAAHLGKLTPTSTCHSITHKSPNPCAETAGHPCTLREVKRTKRPFTVEHVHYDKDGNARNMEVHGYPIFDDRGNVIQMIEYCLDITARKQAESRLEAINKELIKSNRRLNKLALRDSHTGVYNHRYLEEAMGREFSRANRYTQPLSVIMLDIDYFKSINDVYGHQFGDLILQQFARQLKRMVRRYDIVIRFGGEEFVIICPGIDTSAAFILAQRILNAMNLYKFGNSQHSVKLKLSAAVASYPEDKIIKDLDLIDLVDKILNKAKEDGGGRVYSYLDIGKEKIETYKESHADREVTLLKSKLNKLTKRSNQSLIESVFAFAKTIELKDYYTGKHVENTVAYAEEIARSLNLPKEEVEIIKQAATLHDLGKIGISEKILLKRSKLTKSEHEEIKKHPQIAVDIIRPIHFLHDIIPLVLHHHERWDGTGYPSGLKEKEIPTGARIVCIADVYQALISDRPYRKSYSKDEAIETIRDGAGRQFDPQIVRVFLNILEQEK